MTQEANPATPDATQAPDSSSFEDKLAAKFGLDEPTQAPAEQKTEAPSATSGDAEPEIDVEVPADDQPQTEGEWLEIERKGEKRRLSKEEAAKFASMGFDYATNTEALKAEKALFLKHKEAYEAKAKVTPEVIEARANVVAVERALAQYNGLDWTQLAQNDPIQYTQHRAQFDALRDAHQQASYQFHQSLTQAQKVEQTITEAELVQQRQRLYELAPELRDSQRMQAEVGRIHKFLQEIGADDKSLHMVSSSADAFSIVRDAMRYRAAVKARAEKQSAQPEPSMRPGAAPQRQSPVTQKAETIKALHQAKDPDRKKALLDQALALKFGLK